MEKFFKTIAEVMEVEVRDISFETTYRDYDKWDSLMMLNIILEIEEVYNVSIPLESVGNIQTLGDLYEIIK